MASLGPFGLFRFGGLFDGDDGLNEYDDQNAGGPYEFSDPAYDTSGLYQIGDDASLYPYDAGGVFATRQPGRLRAATMNRRPTAQPRTRRTFGYRLTQ